MAYIKFKELAKYFDFKTEVNEESLQDYAKEYIDNDKERFVFAYKPGKVELLFSLDSGYQLHINFIEMNHDKKERIKKIYKIMNSVNI